VDVVQKHLSYCFLCFSSKPNLWTFLYLKANFFFYSIHRRSLKLKNVLPERRH